MPIIRLVMDEKGRVRPRHLRPGAAVLAGKSIQSRVPDARENVPADLVARFDTLVAKLGPAVTAVQGLIDPRGKDTKPATPPEPSPELLDLATREVLTDRRSLNNAIDRLVASFESSVEGATARSASDPKGQAARLLARSFFEDGKRFLAFGHEDQWLAVNQRFNEISTKEHQAAKLLGIDDVADDVALLNAYFGRLLGITETDFAPDVDAATKKQQQQALSTLLELLSQLLHFANLAWPGPEADDVNHRDELIGPYVEQVVKVAENRSKTTDSGSTDAPDSGTTEPTGEAEGSVTTD